MFYFVFWPPELSLFPEFFMLFLFLGLFLFLLEDGLKFWGLWYIPVKESVMKEHTGSSVDQYKALL